MSDRFDDISHFLRYRMKMTHIYQPVMLMTLLESGGCATTVDIAKAILLHDPTQIRYYSDITKRYPGRVLSGNHKVTQRTADGYVLVGFNELSDDEKGRLIEICSIRLEEFLADKGTRPWSHRDRAARYIPGSVKYQVLKAAKFRCLLCGVSADKRPLEPDHIVPRSKGGSNDIWNLQALCGDCNRYKRASDKTDLRDVLASYEYREGGCAFCEPPHNGTVMQNDLAYCILDADSVVEGHTLIIPKRHVTDYFDLYQPELNAVHQLLSEQKTAIQQSKKCITGFNVVFDSGEDAGQTALHCCLQLIPRR